MSLKKTIYNPALLLAIGFVVGVVFGLTDSIMKGASSWAELGIVGKIACVIMLLVILILVVIYWIIPFIRWVIKKK